jgi:two-component system, NarL family, sensor histidine kinase UhpB
MLTLSFAGNTMRMFTYDIVLDTTHAIALACSASELRCSFMNQLRDVGTARTSPARWIPAASQGNLFAIPVLYRVLFANCSFLIVGAVLGSALVGQTHEPDRTPVMIGFMVSGLLLSIVVNFVQLRIALLPLTRLRETMRRVQAGDMSLRAPVSGYDPDSDELAITFNRMLTTVDELSKSRASQILRAQEEERKRIARELHDETGQALTSLLVSLAVLENDFPMPEARTHISQVREIAHDTLRAIRNLSIDLRPSSLDDLGLLPALRWYIKEYQQKIGIPVELKVQGFKARYAFEIETALYRIVQEALTNAAKHAHAKHITVSLVEKNRVAHIVISDDGCGFDVSAIPRTPSSDRGLGLMGMRERATLLNGTVEIASRPNYGTTITVIIPLKKGEVADYDSSTYL